MHCSDFLWDTNQPANVACRSYPITLDDDKLFESDSEQDNDPDWENEIIDAYAEPSKVEASVIEKPANAHNGTNRNSGSTTEGFPSFQSTRGLESAQYSGSDSDQSDDEEYILETTPDGDRVLTLIKSNVKFNMINR